MPNEGGRRSRTTARVDGVTVDRYITANSKEFVARYEIDADFEEPVLVRIVDDFPDAFEVEDVEFKANEVLKRGEVTDSQALIEGVIPPSQEMEVAYDTKLTSGKPRFIGPPVVEEVSSFEGRVIGETPAHQPNETTNDGTRPATDAVVSTATDCAPDDVSHADGSDNERNRTRVAVAPTASDGGEPFRETMFQPMSIGRDNSNVGSEKPNGSIREAEDPSHQDAEDTTDSLPSMPNSHQSSDATLVTRLVDEISSGTVSEGELAELRHRLGTDAQRSTDVKLQRLQAQVASFDAYIDALEALIDEYGTGDEILDDVYDRFDDVDDDLSSLKANQSKASSQRSRLKQRLDAAHDGLDEVRADVDDVRGDVDDVRAEVDDAETEIDDLWSELSGVQGDVGDVQADVEEVEAEVETLSGAYDDLHDDVTHVEATVTSLQDELEAVRDEQGEDIEAVRSELSSVRSDLADLRALMDSLGDVFNTDELDELDSDTDNK